MSKLPSDAEMTKLFVLGQMNNVQIAQKYGVTPQAVNKRFEKLGLARRPYAQEANAELLKVWKVQSSQETGSHHTLSPIQSLRTWLRMRLGDPTLSPRQRTTAVNFEKRIRAKNVVLAYDPEAEKPFTWEPREPRDDCLVIRWPKDRGAPPLDELSVFQLPELPTE